MTESKNPNPTNVNPFNGLSDNAKAAEVAQKLWDQGAFNPDGKPDASQGQKAALEPEPEGAPQRAEPTTRERLEANGDYEAIDRAERYAEQQRGQRGQQLQQALQTAHAARQQLYAEYQGLRAQDPQAADAALPAYQAKEAEINQHLAGLHGHAQQLAQELVAVEREKALRANPQWRDQKVWERDRQQMIDYARGLGISDADISNITDYRHLIALHHASHAGKAPAPKPPGVRVNKVKDKVPPTMRPLVNARERFFSDTRDMDAQARYAQRLLDAGA